MSAAAPTCERCGGRGCDGSCTGTEPGLAELLSATEAFVRRYVALGDSEAATVALWVVHTHVLDASRVTPYLRIHSAEPGCGKTLLLEVLALVVARPWLTARTTAAVLPRKIQRQRPTLLLDESDAGFGGDREFSEALRGILNSGYKRSPGGLPR